VALRLQRSWSIRASTMIMGCRKFFFEELGISEPDVNLGVGSGPHGWQTGQMLIKIEEVLLTEKPDWNLLLGHFPFPPRGYIAIFGKNSGVNYFNCQEERFDPQTSPNFPKPLTPKPTALGWFKANPGDLVV